MFCKHNYEYTQGHFFCTKCGNRKYSGSYRHPRRGKRIGIGLGISLAIIIVFYVTVNNPSASTISSSIIEGFQKLKPSNLELNPDPQLNKPEIDILELEQKIYIRINQERSGMGPLVYDNMIATVARVHSQDMADNNFFGYDSSSGVSVAQRGKNAGYSCGVYGFVGYTELIGLDNRYGHTEDIYSKSTYHWLNEDELANSIVRAWVDSRSSSAGRNAIFGLHQSVGVGVAITSDDKVYVTADFC